MAGLNVKKGDRVVVLAGKDKGKTGDVIAAFPKDERVIVQGVNKVKKHQKATPSNPGGIVEQEAAIHVSNVAHVDPKDGKPTRIGHKVLEDGRKVRVAKRSGEVIDR
jgi:large subunit ribosomal protein L24